MDKETFFKCFVAWCCGVMTLMVALSLGGNIGRYCTEEDPFATDDGSLIEFKDSGIDFTELAWELCSDTGFWRVSCFSGQTCENQRDDSVHKILNLTEENCKRLDALTRQDVSRSKDE